MAGRRPHAPSWACPTLAASLLPLFPKQTHPHHNPPPSRDAAGTGGLSRTHSDASEDLSWPPPEEPEWLGAAKSRMAAACSTRSLRRAGSGRSRRNSAFVHSSSGRPLGSGGALPSRLRHSMSVVDMTQLGSALGAAAGPSSSSSGVVGAWAYPLVHSPLPSEQQQERQQVEHQARYADERLLLDRFGSCEGLSAAVEIFYRRLCCDPAVSQAVNAVPESQVRFIMVRVRLLFGFCCGKEVAGTAGGGVLPGVYPGRPRACCGQWWRAGDPRAWQASPHCVLLLQQQRSLWGGTPWVGLATR